MAMDKETMELLKKRDLWPTGGDTENQRLQLGLPLRMGGAGLPQQTMGVNAAFFGGVAQAAADLTAEPMANFTYNNDSLSVALKRGLEVDESGPYKLTSLAAMKPELELLPPENSSIDAALAHLDRVQQRLNKRRDPGEGGGGGGGGGRDSLQRTFTTLSNERVADRITEAATPTNKARFQLQDLLPLTYPDITDVTVVNPCRPSTVCKPLCADTTRSEAEAEKEAKYKAVATDIAKFVALAFSIFGVGSAERVDALLPPCIAARMEEEAGTVAAARAQFYAAISVAVQRGNARLIQAASNKFYVAPAARFQQRRRRAQPAQDDDGAQQ